MHARNARTGFQFFFRHERQQLLSAVGRRDRKGVNCGLREDGLHQRETLLRCASHTATESSCEIVYAMASGWRICAAWSGVRTGQEALLLLALTKPRRVDQESFRQVFWIVQLAEPQDTTEHHQPGNVELREAHAPDS
eukprot:COSAG06_NODE_88_length_24864_cov_7.159368_3_plen_138_part_00